MLVYNNVMSTVTNRVFDGKLGMFPSFNKNENLGNLLSNTLLVTLDMTSLYTNIPHNEGVRSCRKALKKIDILQLPEENLTELIEMILKKNNFELVLSP